MNQETYQETIDRVAKANGHDLIFRNLELAGFAPVIDQTGGFVLCVGVYGERGYIWASDDVVCIYTHDEEDEGELLISRDDEETNESWALRCALAFEDNAQYLGRLFGDIAFDLLRVLSDESLVQIDFLRGEMTHRIGEEISRVEFCQNSVTGYGWSLDPVEFAESLRASVESWGVTL
jgi:hypothetical protein